MANEEDKIDAKDVKKPVETITINYGNLIAAANGILALAQQVGFIDRDGSPDFSALAKNSLAPDQNTLIDYVLKINMNELIAETDQIVEAADKLAPHVLTNNIPMDDNATQVKEANSSNLLAAEEQARSQKTFKEILALDSPLGYVEDQGLGGIERHQNEINIVKKFLNDNQEKDAWPVNLVNYYQLERRVYNTFQALQAAKQQNSHKETVRQAGLLFSFLHEMRAAAQKEAATRPPFVMPEKPIASMAYEWSDLDKEAQNHFIPEEFKITDRAYEDITRNPNLIVGNKYLMFPTTNEIDDALPVDESVKEFIRYKANQSSIAWSGINWLRMERYLPNNKYVVNDANVFYIITPQADGSAEFKAVQRVNKLMDLEKSVEMPVNADLGKGLVLETTYTISPKKEGEAEASVALKSHTVNVLDKKVFDVIPALNPNPQEKLVEESGLAESPSEAQPAVVDKEQEVIAESAEAHPEAADEPNVAIEKEPKPDSKLVQGLKFAVTPFIALLATAFVAMAIAAVIVASPVLIGLAIVSGAATLLTGAAKFMSNRSQTGKAASVNEPEVASTEQEVKEADKPVAEVASVLHNTRGIAEPSDLPEDVITEEHEDNLTKDYAVKLEEPDDLTDEDLIDEYKDKAADNNSEAEEDIEMPVLEIDNQETDVVRFVRSSTAEALTLLEAGQVKQMNEVAAKLAKVDRGSLENIVKALEKQLAKLGNDNIQKYDHSVTGMLERIQEILETDEIKGEAINIIDDVLKPVGQDFIDNQQEDKLDLLMQCAEAYSTPKGSEDHARLREAFDEYKNPNQQVDDVGLHKPDIKQAKAALALKTGHSEVKAEEKTDVQVKESRTPTASR